MKNVWKKIAALLACIMLVTSMMPTALAAWTTLEVDFRGLTAQAGGQWRMEQLSGSFSVQQDGQEIGRLTADSKGSSMVTLENTSNVLLVPDMATMPEGYLIQQTGYSASVTAGRLNAALVMAYADAGLFTLQTTGENTFSLTNSLEEAVLTFTTEADGSYALPEALPAGVYTVHHVEGDTQWPDFALTLTAYRGAAEQIVLVDEAYALANSLEPVILTPEPTAEPTEEPTPEPTAVPTEEPTPEPTAVPTEEPTPEPTEVPTEEPTPEPTAVPTEEPTPEPTEVPTEEPTPEPTEVPTEEPTPEPTEVPTEEPTPEPTEVPTEEPTAEPTAVPTEEPTPEPTEVPTEEPTPEPTAVPTEEPTPEPTAVPTEEPTPEPTAVPTAEPTAVPVGEPVMLVELPADEASASLNVRVYNDRNSNGARNNYDGGVEGVVLELIPVGSDAPVAVVATDKTAEPTFNGIPAGQYNLRVTLPLGRGFSKTGDLDHPTSGNVMEYSLENVQLSPVLELAAGEQRTVAIGSTLLSGVSGKAWDDVNGDGIMQDDEPGQAGVFISLVGVNNGLVYEHTTDENGEYYISQVKPGNYKMTVTTPEGTMFTKYSKTGGAARSYYTTEGKRSDSRSFKLEEGEVFENRHIGVVGDGVIEAICFLDANFNGLYDEGEAPLAGAEIQIIKTNGKTLSRATSGEDGIARAGALRNGTYSVTATIPEGYAFTCTAEGGNPFENVNGRRKDTVKNIEVDTAAKTTMVLGAVVPATISGVAYLDDNFSGKQDAGEDVVSGLLVALLDENGEKLVVDRTTVKGQYTFTGLNPGTYSMRLEAKAGYAFTKLGEGNYFLNTGDGKGQTKPFAVDMGAQLTGMDIGQILPGTVQGSVFADANDNGVQDEAEAGFVGTVVRLMSEEGEHFAATIGEDGAFCFDAVMPGRYYLQYELPGESAFAKVVSGGNTIAAVGNLGQGEWFDFKVGDEVNAPLCGGLKLGSITGVAFADHNGNGTQEEGEAALPGMSFELVPSRSDIESVTLTTQADGSFAIKGLHPDTYTLTISCPESYVLSRVDNATLPVKPGVNEQSITLDLAMGDSWNDQLLGAVMPATLRGIAWMDENLDGLYDEDEIKPAGATVEVIDQHNGQVFATVAIAEDGSFAAEGLIPGSYTLQHGPAVEGKKGESTFTYEDGMMVMHDITLAEDETRSDLMLGIVCHTTIAGNVWVDMGGKFAAQSGAEMTLTDADGNVLATATSNEQGDYAFDGLMPGAYILQVTLPEGRVVVEPGDERLTDGTHASVMVDCNARNAKSEVITLLMSRDQRSMDVGVVLPGSLGDKVWLDENANGLQDTDESGIPGVKIELMRGDEVVAETTSDQYGFYRFQDVYPATYTLRVNAPDEVKPTQLRTDIPLIASVLGEDGVTTPVQVTSDKANRNADLGFVLVKKDAYPAGYGQGATQDWTKIKNEE